MTTKNASEQRLRTALTLVNDSVRGLRAYHLEPEDCAVKLNQNENPRDWPAELKRLAAEFAAARLWNRYPDFIPGGLKKSLARYAGTTPESIIAGNGSNEILLVLLLSFAAKAKTVIVCSPTFTVYKLLSEGMGARTVSVNLNDDLQYDVGAIKRTASKNPGAMLILCSPNSPVGNVLGEGELRDILDVHAGICVLDQAYAEFGGFDGIGLINEYPNLIVTRTFSKAMAAAGLRLGYMIGNADLIAEINKIKLPYNINFFTEHAASIMLDNVDTVKKSTTEIINERDVLIRYLEKLPLDNVYPSKANFILIRTKRKQDVFDHLKKDGILVRDVSSYPKLENCLRISIGTPDENLKLRESLDRFFTQRNK